MPNHNKISIKYYSTLDSTNTEAFRKIDRGTIESNVIVADTQTVGRGRGRNTWVSESTDNLYFSIILESRFEKSEEGLLSLFVGLMLVCFIKQNYHIDAQVKWPNDLFIGDKKIAGILIENIEKEKKYNIVGIGINLNEDPSRVDLSLEKISTSLAVTYGKTIDKKRFLNDFVDYFFKQYEFFCSQSVLARYESIVFLWQNYRIDTDTIDSAKIIGLNPDGSLRVMTMSGEVRNIYSNEL